MSQGARLDPEPDPEQEQQQGQELPPAARAHLQSEPAKRTLRVLSANLRLGLADVGLFTELATAVCADVVAVQEAGSHHFDALAMSEFPHGDFEPGVRGTGVGIALRNPATAGTIKLGWRDARVMTLRPEDWPELTLELDVVSVHIAAPQVLPPLYGFVLRHRQSKALYNHFAAEPAPPVPEERGGHGGAAAAAAAQRRSTLLVGDFNATPIWPVYRRIASQFTDASIAVAQQRGRRNEPTWGPWPGSPRMLRIDHAFTRGLRTEELQVVEVTGSDHSALVIDVTNYPLPTNSSNPQARAR